MSEPQYPKIAALLAVARESRRQHEALLDRLSEVVELIQKSCPHEHVKRWDATYGAALYEECADCGASRHPRAGPEWDVRPLLVDTEP